MAASNHFLSNSVDPKFLDGMNILNVKSYVNLLNDTHRFGSLVGDTREILNGQLTLSPISPFIIPKGRNYNVNYFRKEMIWKLGADKFDKSIMQHASTWANVVNDDGSFNSNYGQYWFGEQNGLINALRHLVNDVNTRKACIPMLNASHVGLDVRDTVCTESITFLIRDCQLYMVVHMRSSDQIYGLGTDFPTFSVLYRLAFALMAEHYPMLMPGPIKICAVSSHHYKRHFELVDNILANYFSGGSYIEQAEQNTVSIPWVKSTDEALRIICSKGIRSNMGESDLADWLFGESV